MRLTVLLPTCLLLSVPSLLAHADTFTLTGDATTITFSLPAAPTPSFVNVGQFTVDNVPVTVNGSTQTLNVWFYAPYNLGGLCVTSAPLCSQSALIDQGGPQLYSGDESAPTFQTGTYALSDEDFTSNTYDQDFSLTIAAPATVTPEPSSLVLLGTGLVGATGMVRRRFGR